MRLKFGWMGMGVGGRSKRTTVPLAVLSKKGRIKSGFPRGRTLIYRELERETHALSLISIQEAQRKLSNPSYMSFLHEKCFA